MANELLGRRVAILATDGVERVELEQPRQALDQAGASTTLLSIKSGEIAARQRDLEDAGTFVVDGLVSDASVDDYDALVLPGGTVNPDKLRIDENAGGPPAATTAPGPSAARAARAHRLRRRPERPAASVSSRSTSRCRGGVRAEDVEASMNDGVLSVRVPKPQQARPHKIEVK